MSSWRCYSGKTVSARADGQEISLHRWLHHTSEDGIHGTTSADLTEKDSASVYQLPSWRSSRKKLCPSKTKQLQPDKLLTCRYGAAGICSTGNVCQKQLDANQFGFSAHPSKKYTSLKTAIKSQEHVVGCL